MLLWVGPARNPSLGKSELWSSLLIHATVNSREWGDPRLVSDTTSLPRSSSLPRPSTASVRLISCALETLDRFSDPSLSKPCFSAETVPLTVPSLVDKSQPLTTPESSTDCDQATLHLPERSSVGRLRPIKGERSVFQNRVKSETIY
jgi:hypothetical protein